MGIVTQGTGGSNCCDSQNWPFQLPIGNHRLIFPLCASLLSYVLSTDDSGGLFKFFLDAFHLSLSCFPYLSLEFGILARDHSSLFLPSYLLETDETHRWWGSPRGTHSDMIKRELRSNHPAFFPPSLTPFQNKRRHGHTLGPSWWVRIAPITAAVRYRYGLHSNSLED